MGVAVLCLLSVTSCARSDDTVENLKDAIVPPGDTAPSLPGPIRDGQSAEYNWTFSTRLDASNYLAWVGQRLTDQRFTIQRRQSQRIDASRLTDGDTYQVRIEIVGQSPTQVGVTVRGTPD